MTAPAINRSAIEFTKRAFLDRLTVDAQPLLQPASIDTGPGDDYLYGGTYDPFDFGVGGDCSGGSGIWVGAAILGAFGMTWGRMFSTETFPGPFGSYFRQTSQADLLSGAYPIKVCIHHGGGGPNSHMNVCVDNWLMESNGDHGTCTLNYGAIGQDSNYWNDFWVCDSPIVEDTPFRQAMGYPRGLDYAGGRIPAAALSAAGISFVSRYLSDGGPGLPGKLLLPDEYADLTAGGIGVMFNYETTADFMLSDDGASIAQRALNTINGLPGAPAEPVVYFSCDFDESESQQNTINEFCRRAQSVLPGRVGLYGPYYCLKRAADAGVINYLWQTEAWSGFGDGQDPHVDSRVNVMQRNNIGYMNVAGVQCDVNEAHTDFFGQSAAAAQPTTAVPNSPAPTFTYPSDHDMLLQLWEQQFGFQGTGWEALYGKTADGSRGLYVDEAIAKALAELTALKAATQIAAKPTPKPRKSPAKRKASNAR